MLKLTSRIVKRNITWTYVRNATLCFIIGILFSKLPMSLLPENVQLV